MQACPSMSRGGNLEAIDFFKTEIAEFIPIHNTRLLRFARNDGEGPLAKTAKGFLSNLPEHSGADAKSEIRRNS